jgi:SlyX protein
MEPRLQRAEERIAHLERMVEELSEVLARQDREIAALTRRLLLVMDREAERAADGGGGVILADERPPHW